MKWIAPGSKFEYIFVYRIQIYMYVLEYVCMYDLFKVVFNQTISKLSYVVLRWCTWIFKVQALVIPDSTVQCCPQCWHFNFLAIKNYCFVVTQTIPFSFFIWKRESERTLGHNLACAIPASNQIPLIVQFSNCEIYILPYIFGHL